jgi:hypothetical protein
MTVQNKLTGKDRGGEQDPDIKVKGSDTTDLARSVGTDETDKVHRKNTGGSGTAFDPHQSLSDDVNLAKDEHLPQDIFFISPILIGTEIQIGLCKFK